MDQSNNVNLRWNEHQRTLVSVFDTLLDSEKLTDCTISAEGRHIKAHKIILSACSPYFEELFTDSYENNPMIILHDVKYNLIKAIMDFMYCGEVNVPQEELSGVLKLSEFLQVRGLSGSGCVDDVNMQRDSARNSPPVLLDTLSSQPASVSCCTSGWNEPEGKMESFLGCSPAASLQEGSSDTIRKSIQKYRKSSNHSGSDKGAGQNLLKEVFTPDLDSLHQLPFQRQVQPTTSNSTGGPVYSPFPCQSVRSELQGASLERATTKNEQFVIPEAVLPDKKSANLSAHQQEVSLETKSEVLNHMEIIEDLTLSDDNDDYRGDSDYLDDSNSVGEFRSVGESVGYEENFRTQENNGQHPSFGSDYLNNMTLTASRTVLHKRFSCDSCGKSYRYLRGLTRHLRLECGKEPQLQCSLCNYRCSRGYNLKRHVATLHCQMQKKYAFF